MTAEPTPNRPRPVMRREPVQRRSAARVSSILDACAALLDEYDYDLLTTSKIAERAGVPIGSLYQYFPDKRAVVQALVDRNFKLLSAEVERNFAAEPLPGDWRQTMDRLIDANLRMLEEVPGFARIWLGDVVDTHLSDPQDDYNAIIAAKLSQLFARAYQTPDSDELQHAFWMSIEVSSALIKLALRLKDDQYQTTLATCRELIRSILSRHLDPPTT